MREHQCLNVAKTVGEQCEIALQGLAKTGNARVDGGQATPVFDQIPVDQRAPEPVNAWDDVTRDDDFPILAGRPSGGPAAAGRSVKRLLHAPTQV